MSCKYKWKRIDFVRDGNSETNKPKNGMVGCKEVFRIFCEDKFLCTLIWEFHCYEYDVAKIEWDEENDKNLKSSRICLFCNEKYSGEVRIDPPSWWCGRRGPWPVSHPEYKSMIEKRIEEFIKKL
jgi:hypothetical protein